MVTQLTFGWQNYHWAGIQSQTGKNKSYLYYFKRVPPGEPNYGAFHSAEFGYALKTLKKWDRPFVKWDHDLSEIMSSYWVNFAATGDPNGKGLPYWPVFKKSDPQVIILGDKAEAASLPYREQLEFLDKVNK
jgi:para-nitrobenzyl esterase